MGKRRFRWIHILSIDSLVTPVISSQWIPLLFPKCRASCRCSVLSLVRLYWAWYHYAHHTPVLKPSCFAQESNDLETQFPPSRRDTSNSIYFFFLIWFSLKFDFKFSGKWCSVYEQLQNLPTKPCYFPFWSQAQNFQQNVMDVTECRLWLALFIRIKIHCLRENNLTEA